MKLKIKKKCIAKGFLGKLFIPLIVSLVIRMSIKNEFDRIMLISFSTLWILLILQWAIKKLPVYNKSPEISEMKIHENISNIGFILISTLASLFIQFFVFRYTSKFTNITIFDTLIRTSITILIIFLTNFVIAKIINTLYKKYDETLQDLTRSSNLIKNFRNHQGLIDYRKGRDFKSKKHD